MIDWPNVFSCPYFSFFHSQKELGLVLLIRWFVFIFWTITKSLCFLYETYYSLVHSIKKCSSFFFPVKSVSCNIKVIWTIQITMVEVFELRVDIASYGYGRLSEFSSHFFAFDNLNKWLTTKVRKKRCIVNLNYNIPKPRVTRISGFSSYPLMCLSTDNMLRQFSIEFVKFTPPPLKKKKEEKTIY